MIYFRDKKQNKGFTLVETLVAIAILLTTLVGPITVASRSLQASFFIKQQMTAVYLAQEGIESILLLRDQSALVAADAVLGDDNAWEWFGTLDASCKNSSQKCGINENFTIIANCSGSDGAACTLRENDGTGNALYTHQGSGPFSEFTRKIYVTEIIPGEAQISVEISWYATFLGRVHSLSLSTAVSNQYSRYE